MYVINDIFTENEAEKIHANHALLRWGRIAKRFGAPQ